jgi:hypothetical protein
LVALVCRWTQAVQDPVVAWLRWVVPVGMLSSTVLVHVVVSSVSSVVVEVGSSDPPVVVSVDSSGSNTQRIARQGCSTSSPSLQLDSRARCGGLDATTRCARTLDMGQDAVVPIADRVSGLTPSASCLLSAMTLCVATRTPVVAVTGMQRRLYRAGGCRMEIASFRQVG